MTPVPEPISTTFPLAWRRSYVRMAWNPPRSTGAITVSYNAAHHRPTILRLLLQEHTQRTEGHHIARVLRHDLSDLIVIERASGGNASSQYGISTWAEDSRRRITTTPIRLNAMDSNMTSRNEPVA